MMKKLTFICLMVLPFASLWGVEQPHFQVPDPASNENTRELSYNLDQHRHLGTDGSTALATNDATTGYMLIGQGVGIPPIWQAAGRLFQIIQYQVTAASSTVSATFVPSSLTGAITPTSSSSKILILVSGTIQNNNPSAQDAFLTVFRGSTNIGDATKGFVDCTGAGTVRVDNPASIVYLDSPASAATLTYTVYMRGATGTTTMGFPSAAGTIANLILAEIGQ